MLDHVENHPEILTADNIGYSLIFSSICSTGSKCLARGVAFDNVEFYSVFYKLSVMLTTLITLIASSKPLLWIATPMRASQTSAI